MSPPQALEPWPDEPLIAHREDQAINPATAARILELVAVLSTRGSDTTPDFGPDPGGSLAALQNATTVALAVGPDVGGLVVVEAAAAVLAAPWLADRDARTACLLDALQVAGELLPPGRPEPGRDTGTWGGVAAAIGIGRRDRPDQMRQIACIAASLALAAVPATEGDKAYLAIRSGHAAASAVLAVTLADAGFVGDLQAIDELRKRLGTTAAPPVAGRSAELATRGVKLLEEAVH